MREDESDFERLARKQQERRQQRTTHEPPEPEPGDPGAQLPPEDDDPAADPERPAATGNGTIKVGDFVQWISCGVDQFKPPRQVTKIDASAGYAWVDGSNTGIPINELTAVAAPQPKPKPKPSQRRRYSLNLFGDAEIPMATNYLIKGALPRTGLAVIWGPPKCGKSFWTYDLVMHIATGRPYRSRPVQQGTIVYLALEGGAGFVTRMVAWRQTHFPNGKPPTAVPFYLITERCDLVRDHKQLITDIRAQLEDTKPAAITIDTLNRSIGGSENKDEDMTKYIDAAAALGKAFECLIIIIHHCGTAGNRPRGHTSLAGADDCQIAVDRDKNGVITATVEHAKDFEAGAKFSSKLDKIELGNDIDGDPITSCVIIEAEPAETGPKLKKSQRFLYTALQTTTRLKGLDAPAEAQLPAGKKVVTAADLRQEFIDTYPSDNRNTRNQAYGRALMDLIDKKLIAVWSTFVWLCEPGDSGDS